MTVFFFYFLLALPRPSPSSFSSLPLDHLSGPRLTVRVNGGEGLGSSLGGVGLGLMRDLGAMSFENPCELREKTSSPFSSNRTMFETEEVTTCLSLLPPSSLSLLPLSLNLFVTHHCFSKPTQLPETDSPTPFLPLPLHPDGNPCRPRGDAAVPGPVCGSVSVCGGHLSTPGLHPAAQQTGLPEPLQQVCPCVSVYSMCVLVFLTAFLIHCVCLF